MPRGRADIANTALRIFLQEMGAAYDEERELPLYDGRRHFLEVRAFFGERCCYCGANLDEAPGDTAQDHLIPMNKSSLGLHAWGNVVPACQACNSKKHGQEWHAYLVQRAGADASERYRRVTDFVAHYQYAPDLERLRGAAEALYAEVGTVGMALITLKVRRVRDGL